MSLILPFPISILLFFLWLAGLLLTSIAQPVFIVEGVRGMRAMARSIQLVRGNLSRVFIVLVIRNILLISINFLIYYLLMPELFQKLFELSRIEDPEIMKESIFLIQSEFKYDQGVRLVINRVHYFASLLFYPFASLLTCLLYFDLAQRQQVLNVDQLAKFSNKLFGTPLARTAESASPADEEVIDPTDVEILDPDPSEEDKYK